MGKRLAIPPHLTLEELAGRYRGASDPVLRSHWQIIWLLAQGHSTREVAEMTHDSAKWIRELARRYREEGPAAMGDRRHGNPGGHARALLTADQREQLRQALVGPAPDGGLWTGRQVAIWMTALLGRPVAEQRGWEDLRHVGFTLQRPRPGEIRADPEAQDAFKKGAWTRSSRRYGRPIPTPR
jgi:transposase